MEKILEMNRFSCSELKGLSQELVGKENSSDFASWAFGNGFWEWIGMESFAKAWNERHGDLHKIEINYPLVHDMIIMTNLWKEYLRNV